MSRVAVFRGTLLWADLLDRVDAPDRARQLRWDAVRAAPWHPAVCSFVWRRLKSAVGWRPA